MTSARQTAFRFVLTLGIANLFADFTYEAARSINGQFLATLGASAVVVGITAGAGELVGYALRSLTGWISDKTGRYWLSTIIGYAVNMAAVPALALAGNWPLAALLIVAERTGRAIRKPSTAAMLSHAGHQIGHGWVFGLNEALDQAGATIGPLVMALVIAVHGGYHKAYALLLVPAAITVLTIFTARHFFPRPRDLEASVLHGDADFGRRYWLYMAAAACVGAGFADFALIGFHLQSAHIVESAVIPVYYAVAMGIGAIGAPVLGRLFDANRRLTLLGSIAVSALFAPLVFLGGAQLALVGMVVWGFGMVVQETLFRSLVAGIVSAKRRATAFGVFDTGFGIAWFAGSAIMGVLYSASLPGLVIFSVVAQLLAIPIFVYSGFVEQKRAA